MAVLTAALGTLAMTKAEAPPNLVVNPGFETGMGPSSAPPWALKDRGSAVVGSPVHGGSRALRVVNDFTGDSKQPSHDTIQTVAPVTPGREYEYAVWVQGENVQGVGAGGKPMAMLTWRDAGGRPARRWLNLHAPYGTYPWRLMTAYAEAPPGATACDVYTRSWWDCTNGVSYWDDFLLRERDLVHRGARLATYQAEEAAAYSRCERKSAVRDYTGSGYVAVTDNGATIEWNAVNAGAGPRYLVLRYGMEAGQPGWELFVNGASQGTRKPLATASPESWATLDWPVTLNDGDNAIRLILKKGVVGPWIDRLDVHAVARPLPDAPPGPAGAGHALQPPRRQGGP